MTTVRFETSEDVVDEIFLNKLTGRVLEWNFPAIRRAGVCTVTVETPEPPPAPKRGRPPGWEMCEMAPVPLERALPVALGRHALEQ